MPLVSSPIPNLVGGITQQPPSMRLNTMCDWAENVWHSVVSGLQKRPCSQHVSNLGSQFSPGSIGHIIERDQTYRYLVVVQNGDLKVVDLNTGQLQTVNFPEGKTYLNASSPIDAFRFVTIGDYTFIANRNVVVAAKPVAESGAGPVPGQTRSNPTTQATVYVKLSAYNTYYSVYVNGVLYAQYLTPDGASGSASAPDTGQIASQLNAQLNSNGFTTIQNGSCVTITNFNPSWTLQTQGGSGDKSCVGFIRDVQQFADLPPVMFNGRIVRVAGDMTTDQDDYFVVYKGGVWVETLDWNTGETLDSTTMPHVVIREPNGTWTFKAHTWGGRQVGNLDSSKSASFVGMTINDVFTYTNRFGILSDENVILSEAGNYENFYRTTTAQLLDSDPLDIAVLHNNVDILYHAVPYNRDLLLMSEKDQFRLTYTNYIGQKTTRVEYSSSFNVSQRNQPQNVGNSVYFVDDRVDYSFAKLTEFFPKDNSTVDDADDATAPIPELIPVNVDFIAASNRAKTIVLHSVSRPNTLYVYKFFWSDSKKVQNSWCVWTFADCDNIQWAGFSGNFLYLLIARNGSTFLETIRTDESVWVTDEDFEVMLDRRAVVAPSSVTYNSAMKKTTIALPYSTGIAPQVVLQNVANGITGLTPAVTVVNGNTITVDDDMTGYQVTVGVPYTMTYQFSTFFMRQRVPYVGSLQLIQDGRLQVRYLTLEYHDTSYFRATCTIEGRDPAVSTFSGAILGSPNLLGRIPVASGKFRIPIMCENYKMKLVLTNDSPFPSAFGSAEWQGVYTPKSAQRVI